MHVVDAVGIHEIRVKTIAQMGAGLRVYAVIQHKQSGTRCQIGFGIRAFPAVIKSITRHIHLDHAVFSVNHAGIGTAVGQGDGKGVPVNGP